MELSSMNQITFALSVLIAFAIGLLGFVAIVAASFYDKVKKMEKASALSSNISEPSKLSMTVIAEVAAVASPTAPSTPDLDQIARSKNDTTPKGDLNTKKKKWESSRNVTFDSPTEEPPLNRSEQNHSAIKGKPKRSSVKSPKPNDTMKGDPPVSTPKHNHCENHEQMGSIYGPTGLRASARKKNPPSERKTPGV